MTNKELIVSYGVKFLAATSLPKQERVDIVDKTILYQKAVSIIDEYIDSGKTYEERHVRAQEALNFLDSGLLPIALNTNRYILNKFLIAFRSLKGTVQLHFEQKLKQLLIFTENMRTIKEPAIYIKATDKEARLTSVLLAVFLTNKVEPNSKFTKSLSSFGALYNRLDNAKDLKPDFDSNTTQVPPTLTNAFLILFAD